MKPDNRRNSNCALDPKVPAGLPMQDCLDLMQESALGIALLNDQWCIKQANKTLAHWLGKKSSQQLHGTSLTALGIDEASLRKALAASKGKVRSITEQVMLVGVNQVIPCQLNLTAQLGSRRQFLGALLIFNDQTLERDTLEQLWQRHQFYDALIRDTSVMIVILDAKGAIVDMNRAAEELSGYAKEEFLGKVVSEIFALEPGQGQASRERMDYLTSGRANSVPVVSLRFRRKNGTLCFAEGQTSVLRCPDGTIDGFITTVLDVTERVRLEEELVKTVEREQSRIGHDLHDGIGQTLTGAISMMEAFISKLKQRDGVRDAQRILEVMREAIMETRRISHGLSPAAVKNRGLIGGLQFLAEQARAYRKIQVELEVDASYVGRPEMIETHLYRIAQEAVNNAARHARPSSLSILLRQHAREIVLEVRDNGCGFATRKKQEDGIGLRVMQHRAMLIGGTLNIKSKRDQGTRIECRVPLLDSALTAR